MILSYRYSSPHSARMCVYVLRKEHGLYSYTLGIPGLIDLAFASEKQLELSNFDIDTVVYSTFGKTVFRELIRYHYDGDDLDQFTIREYMESPEKVLGDKHDLGIADFEYSYKFWKKFWDSYMNLGKGEPQLIKLDSKKIKNNLYQFKLINING